MATPIKKTTPRRKVPYIPPTNPAPRHLPRAGSIFNPNLPGDRWSGAWFVKKGKKK